MVSPDRSMPVLPMLTERVPGSRRLPGRSISAQQFGVFYGATTSDEGSSNLTRAASSAESEASNRNQQPSGHQPRCNFPRALETNPSGRSAQLPASKGQL